MWFIFSIIALLCWSGSDLFSKIGCRDSEDKYSHLKMVMAVGAVMGIHALYQIIFGGVEINGGIILTYLPVSMLYILSMTIGYVGLRYIELSISSPICNSSGAIVAVLSLITMGAAAELPAAAYAAVAAVCLGVLFLGITESTEDEELRAQIKGSGIGTSATRAGLRWRCLWSTVCWTRLAPLPTASCLKSSTRTAQTPPMS